MQIKNGDTKRSKGDYQRIKDLGGFIRLEGFAGAWSINSEKLTPKNDREMIGCEKFRYMRGSRHL